MLSCYESEQSGLLFLDNMSTVQSDETLICVVSVLLRFLNYIVAALACLIKESSMRFPFHMPKHSPNSNHSVCISN